MLSITVFRALVTYVRRQAPDAYRIESAALRDHYGRRLLGIRDHYHRHLIGRTYFDAKARLVIRIARQIANRGL